MVFVGLYVVDAALKGIEKVSKKPFNKRTLLVGTSNTQKVINNIIGG